MTDEEEQQFASYQNFLTAARANTNQAVFDSIWADPANDDYHYFRGSDWDAKKASILERYKRINNPQGNSPDNDNNNERYDTSYKTTPDVEDIKNIQNSGKSGDMLVKLLLNYRVHYQEEGFSMYDPTAVAYLLAPQMFETKDVFVDVECAGGLTAGCTVVDLAGYLGEKPNATVCVGVDQKAFQGL